MDPLMEAYRQAANELALQAGIIKEPVTDGGVLGEWYWVELLREVVERGRSK